MIAARNTAAPVRTGGEIARFETLDERFVRWAKQWGATEIQFPALIDRSTLERAEYTQAFPHLLMSACACVDPAQPLTRLLAAENLAPSGWLLSPAVCYHAYPEWENHVLDTPRVLTARGRCFRREAEFVPSRRQVEFEMREIILGGAPDWIALRAGEARQRVAAIAGELGLSGNWEAASDPFFLPTAQGKAYVQRLQETKHEFVVRTPQTLAIASVNRHGTFFGERFNIRLGDGAFAHTACVAFGLDRWAGATKR
jgi:hypothetical protein